MFRHLTVAAVLIVLMPAGFSFGQPSGSGSTAEAFAWSNRNQSRITVQEIVNQISDDDVVVLGENHNNDSGHQFQFDVIEQLVNDGVSVAIAMEQFERDVQGAVDDYLAGRIDEQEFLASSRPWSNYQQHYRPIIEFAKTRKLPVIAANTPKPIAKLVSKGETVRGANRVFMPRSTIAPQDLYWENFVNVMKGHVGADGASKLKNFYNAQCLKDDSMAEAITDYLASNRHQKKLVVHLCGHMHSDYGLGTVFRVLHRRPLSRITVITMESQPESGEPDFESVAERAHFVLWTTSNRKTVQDE